MDNISSPQRIRLNFQIHARIRSPDNNENAPLSVGIIPLPPEMVYDILDYLPVEDLVSFTFCRWDFFCASVDFLMHKMGPALQSLDSLVEIFKDKRWPKQWLLNLILKSTKLGALGFRGFICLVALFEKKHWPEKVLRDIVSACASHGTPIPHSCLRCEFIEGASLYLKACPCAIFDTDQFQMTILQVHVLCRATACIEAIEAILREISEPDQRRYVNQLDDFNQTALDYAIRISPPTVIHALIRAGAEFDNHDQLGFTLLMNACHLGRVETVQCLGRHGASVTAASNVGLSALEYVMMGESRSKDSLLKYLGPRASQYQLNRALSLARGQGNEFMNTLIECGADAQSMRSSEDMLSIRTPRPPSPTTIHQYSALPVIGSAPESWASNIVGPPMRDSINLTRRESTNEGRQYGRDNTTLRAAHSANFSAENAQVDECAKLGLVASPLCAWVRWRPADTFSKGDVWRQGFTSKRVRLPEPISNVKYIDEIGYTHRRYRRANIEKIVGVVVAEKLPCNSFVRAPTAYVKVKWTGVSYEDLVLCTDNCS
ncbi:hypothetical protein N7478_010191 [Penicillium angulare]|uniref:uncharacterized protein n=1 Tax=Penicillium angulare TaxID=116970 RepID=UPI00253FA83B|nr:uncharacterized protein N7478_010191 [Penicillium angulare]KAJ5267383.1 hypothetical protein N7478_010191 [Penicillium angulare]